MRAASNRVSPTETSEEWFASWFDSEHYHRLYAHRDEHEAAALIDRLVHRLRPRQGASVLDLGCGAGRHARRLAASGLDVTGVDLSAASIASARLSARHNLRFARHDMRQPFGVRAYDYILSLFTSFGYFDDRTENLTVLDNVAMALKPGGMLVLDYLNVWYAEAHQVSREVVEREGTAYRITRWSDAAHLFKRIVVDDGRRGDLPEYSERVAKLSLEEFRFLFAVCGLRIEAVFGDYRLRPFDVWTSPRLMLVARKSAA